jgi:ankyrin repeat protein
MKSEEEFFKAIKSGNKELVAELIEKNPNFVELRYDGHLSPVLLAMYYNEPDIANLLKENGTALDLFAAAAVGSRNVLLELLVHQPDGPNAVAPDGFQPLGLAAFFGNSEAVRLLIEKGADVNTASQNEMRVTPLHSAVAHRHLQIARLLLEHDANVNARQADDFTALHAAAQNGQLEMVKLLLEFGAETEARTRHGETPLGLAQRFDNVDVIELLQAN